jgi:hypothetical protein
MSLLGSNEKYNELGIIEPLAWRSSTPHMATQKFKPLTKTVEDLS